MHRAQGTTSYVVRHVAIAQLHAVKNERELADAVARAVGGCDQCLLEGLRVDDDHDSAQQRKEKKLQHLVGHELTGKLELQVVSFKFPRDKTQYETG